MIDYFHRQVQLWGADTQNLLQSKKIAIIGSGGLGSSLAFALGSSGIGKIHMVDFDEVSTHNIHRQITFKIGDEGKNKAVLNALMIEQRCPFVKATPHECNFEEFIKKNIEVDLIIDATDNLPTRAEIDEYCKIKKLPWIYGSVEAFHGQVCFFEESSFRDAFKISSKTPEGIAAPIVMHIASLQANLALRYLAGFSVKKDYLYYLFFNADGELVTQKFSLPKSFLHLQD
ncbi:MAG: thiamine biosynthesis protein ThiF [Sulfurimonas sp. RIFOXYD12_FULL_33_39]|uniref:HesA/MoeB/ThiF family protein n=1 Tax=unclassified Sulfurimonas TaxID=2623549 RepID=UPI0008C55AF3|nr:MULTISPECIES: ThiF family adenylyltransferase [unclassified Sulfurimonas]OHE07366.1 MAG: thiamine biosynthesis protein ThiF [Sulfurimonas sp. RIFCSPLOWO2_12_FULL_34_6]OHE08963.1 MAG: thiamine biosynthesis protein ThiF [Sulfurimonas sp. RIFOXYD12_FULL_33_39]OHE14273.1 MAG: thiamine biosynthesis protein ThiF [Sulfurimonas sp. RIFOXYD2_FULL_34_21]DAB28871.1 MAG TPA: thiamine biosynthesis protein ThiF [Sulfurimonas sp. UBA10385]